MTNGSKSILKNTMQKPEVSFWMALIIPLIGIAFTWGVMSNRLDSLEKRFDYFGGRFAETQVKNEERFDEVDGSFTIIQIQLAEIQKDIIFIKENIR